MKTQAQPIHGLRVLFITAEASPFVKVGGLGDYSGSLPKAVQIAANDRKIKIDFKIVLPLFQCIKDSFNLKHLFDISLKYANRFEKASIFQTCEGFQDFYFIRRKNKAFPSPVYTADARIDGDKFAFISLAALELVRSLDWSPDIIHTNDWHTAFSARQAQLLRFTDPFFKKSKIVISLHNLPFMGAGSESIVNKLGLAIKDEPSLPFWGRTQPLPIGLTSSDKIIVVSPGYAREIQTAKFGCGLERYLKTNRSKITGILNGIDIQTWDPRTDPIITHYSENDLENKQANKIHLTEISGLPTDKKIPLFVIVSRLDWQKGIDLIFDAFTELKKKPWSLIILGTGGEEIQLACRSFERSLSKKVRFFQKFDPELSRKVYAGGDFFLMPSRYEPCGLSQLIALRYGTIPVAASVGGLKDTIITEKGRNTGILFKPEDQSALAEAVEKAINLFTTSDEFRNVQIRAMREDFSWRKSAKKYLTIYQTLSTN